MYKLSQWLLPQHTVENIECTWQHVWMAVLWLYLLCVHVMKNHMFTHMQPIMKNYKHAWISLCHENMSATGHEKHMACSMQVMNQMSCNTCHETMIMKTHVMTWPCMETHHEQHMSWTPHEFQVLWFYHGIASAHNAKKPTQPQVPVLVLTQKLQSLSEHTCRSFKFVSLSCAVPLQCRQLHRSLVAFGR